MSHNCTKLLLNGKKAENIEKVRWGRRNTICFFLRKNVLNLHQSTATSTWWCGPRHRLSWVKMVVAFPRVSITPDTPLIQSIFCRAALRTTAEGQHVAVEIGRLVFSFLLPLCCSSSYSSDERQCSS